MIASNKHCMLSIFTIFAVLRVSNSFAIIGNPSSLILLSNNIYQHWGHIQHQVCSTPADHSRWHLNVNVKLGASNVVEANNIEEKRNRNTAHDEGGTGPTTAIYVGSIDWKIPQERVYQVILKIFQKGQQESASGVSNRIASGGSNSSHDIEITEIKKPILLVAKDQIKIKPKTNKKRDEDKLHGGSLIISFDNEYSAQSAMNILQSSMLGKNSDLAETFNMEDALNSKSKIQIRWSLKEEKKHSSNGQVNHKKKDEALIQHRKKRALKYQRQRQRIAEKTDSLISKLIEFVPSKIDTLSIQSQHKSDDDGDLICNEKSISRSPSLFIDWSAVPHEIDPIRGGKLKRNSNRGYRKQAQVEAFLYVLQNALLDGYDEATGEIKVADLGCGGGNLSLPLAWFFKEKRCESDSPSSAVSSNIGAKVVAIDINKHALERLDRRAKDIGLHVETVEEDLLNLISESESKSHCLESCSAIVSLHACGAASDLAIEAAVSHGLPFAVSPCCIGKTKSIRSLDRLPSLATERGGTPDGITFPRSEALSSILRRGEDDDVNDYSLILSAADYSMKDSKHEKLSPNPIDLSTKKILPMTEQEKAFHRRGRMAKLIVETDRLKFAEEQGYSVRMMELPGLGLNYPKRELLLGAKKGTLQAHRISHLSSHFSTQLRAKSSDNDEFSSTAVDDYDNESDDASEISDQMDLRGFTNYLLPYTLAFLGSLAVTAAFFKFVLMDY